MSLLNIIVVEDHELLRDELVTFLTRPDWVVRGAADGEALQRLMADKLPDLLVLDLNLPGEDGLSIANRIRARHPSIGLIMLTARAAPTDRALGYGSGADVYLTKPANIGELESVIHNLSRRMRPVAYEAPPLILSKMRLYRDAQKTVRLTLNEREVLMAMINAPDNKVDMASLVRLLYPEINTLPPEEQKDAIPAHRQNVVVLVSRLRQKVGMLLGEPDLIRAIRGYGYLLTSKVTVEN